MTPTKTRIVPATLVTDEEVRQSIGLFDDQSTQTLVERLLTAAESAIRAHITEPLSVDEYKAWFRGWPSAGEFAYQILGLQFGDGTRANGAYYDAGHNLRPLTGSELMADVTVDGRVICTAGYELSERYGAPVVVTITGLESGERLERVREAVLQTARHLYQHRGTEGFDNTQTVRSIAAQMLGSATVASV